MTIRQHAHTEAQQKSIVKIEKAAKQVGLNIRYGCSIGKEPQAILIDVKYQGGEIYINRDGKITIIPIGRVECQEYTDIVSELKKLTLA